MILPIFFLSNVIPDCSTHRCIVSFVTGAGDKDEAKIYFEKEYLTYPESKTYIQSLMEKLGL